MPTKKKNPGEGQPENSLERLDKQILEEREKLVKIRDIKCYPLLLSDASIGNRLVDDVFDDLSKNYSSCDNLDVILDSSGGDIDAAYNLAQLLRRYGPKRLVFIVPRWAKSAATLLVCGGDEILMTPVAELGPIDPQITAFNPLEQRMEEFSPLHIESTLELIRQEYKNDNVQLADGLLRRLQFPLTLGSFKKSLDIGKQYAEKLLTTRMLRDEAKKEEMAAQIATKLTMGYTDHGYCINYEETKELGLKCNEMPEEMLKVVWSIHRLANKKREIIRKKKEERVQEQLKHIPKEILKQFPPASGVSPKMPNVQSEGDGRHD